jgi:hypothetical protein
MSSHWSKCINLAGKPAGLRFHCATCNFTIPYSAPTKVPHCGKVEEFEKHWWQSLPVFDMRENRPKDLLWDGQPRVIGDKLVMIV